MTTQHVSAWVPELPRTDSFASRLRLLRLSLGDLSVEAMAARCGVASQNYRRWEAGRTPHRMNDIVRQIHDATGVDMAWLMWGVTPPDQGERQTACFTAVSHPRFSRTTANLAGLAVPA